MSSEVLLTVQKPRVNARRSLMPLCPRKLHFSTTGLAWGYWFDHRTAGAWPAYSAYIVAHVQPSYHGHATQRPFSLLFGQLHWRGSLEAVKHGKAG